MQIAAGEEIEHMFGARFGLSTLAAAGFGNLISDVVGLGTAEPVQVCLTTQPLGCDNCPAQLLQASFGASLSQSAMTAIRWIPGCRQSSTSGSP